MEEVSLFEKIYGLFYEEGDFVFARLLGSLCDSDNVEVFTELFPFVGVTTFIVSLLVAFAYYIWPINHPRFKSWWSWLIMLVLNMVINFGVAVAFVYNRVADVNGSNDEIREVWIDDQLNDLAAQEGELIDVAISQYCHFGMANVCVCAIFFVLCSLMLNWFSTNAKFSPIRK